MKINRVSKQAPPKILAIIGVFFFLYGIQTSSSFALVIEENQGNKQVKVNPTYLPNREYEQSVTITSKANYENFETLDRKVVEINFQHPSVIITGPILEGKYAINYQSLSSSRQVIVNNVVSPEETIDIYDGQSTEYSGGVDMSTGAINFLKRLPPFDNRLGEIFGFRRAANRISREFVFNETLEPGDKVSKNIPYDAFNPLPMIPNAASTDIQYQFERIENGIAYFNLQGSYFYGASKGPMQRGKFEGNSLYDIENRFFIETNLSIISGAWMHVDGLEGRFEITSHSVQRKTKVVIKKGN